MVMVSDILVVFIVMTFLKRRPNSQPATPGVSSVVTGLAATEP